MVGTSLVPTRPAPRRAAEGMGGAAWRRDRSHAQPRAAPGFGREHGEHGEDPPLARSEHRGTYPQAEPFLAVCPHLPTAQSSISLNFNFRGSQAIDFVMKKHPKSD